MIHITIKTKRVYSHDGNGMPKFETIDTTLQDGVEFEKFLRYLPMKNFMLDKLKIVSVIEDGKEIDKSKWETMLGYVINGMTKQEATLEEKYALEKQRNDQLEARMAELEKMIPKKASVKQEQGQEQDELSDLRVSYTEKTGKKPFHGWDEKTLKQKIK